MKLCGHGPWGAEDVSRATSVPARTLHRWHRNGWAQARDATSRRNCLRYSIDDVNRLCAIQAMREDGLRTGRAARLCDAIQRHVHQSQGPD